MAKPGRLNRRIATSETVIVFNVFPFLELFNCCCNLPNRSKAKRHNVGLQRRARTAASDKPRMRDMLIARPLHAFVGRRALPLMLTVT
jgi:hypothetical protein